jgi:hypothetical protein
MKGVRIKNLTKDLLKEFKTTHIYIALTTGFSIILLAIFSKWILSEPIEYLALAASPFVATIFESFYSHKKDSKICTNSYWVLGILGATAFVIIFHMF